ncbi:MAG: hypothetical protein GY716_07835 [bacterium]|nr:hypothetical protein [bacterium]
MTDKTGRKALYWIPLPEASPIFFESVDRSGNVDGWPDRASINDIDVWVPHVPGALVGTISSGGQVSLLGSGLLSLDRVSEPEVDVTCPKVHLVSGHDRPSDAKIVFFGEGFGETIDDYRCAAHIVAQDLRDAVPLDYWNRVSIYRVDARDPDPGIEVACCTAEDPGKCCRDGDTCEGCDLTHLPWEAPEECKATVGRQKVVRNTEGPDFMELTGDRAFGCYKDKCQTIWGPWKEIRDFSDANCIDGLDVALVLANSDTGFGGGHFGFLPRLAVATLPDMSGNEEDRWWLPIHELGHALGLLDEYERGSGIEYDAGRNVISMEDLLSGEQPPWEDECKTINSSWKTSPHTSSSCDVQCTQKCHEEGGCLPGMTPNARGETPRVGLWQGASYDPCDYFRSAQNCVMRAEHDEFCAACKVRLRDHALEHTPLADAVLALSTDRSADDLRSQVLDDDGDAELRSNLVLKFPKELLSPLVARNRAWVVIDGILAEIAARKVEFVLRREQTELRLFFNATPVGERFGSVRFSFGDDEELADLRLFDRLWQQQPRDGWTTDEIWVESERTGESYRAVAFDIRGWRP